MYAHKKWQGSHAITNTESMGKIFMLQNITINVLL